MAPADKAFTDALQAGIKIFSVRDRSESQLRSRLSAAGFDRHTIDAVVVRLQSKNVLNDARFAESVVRGRIEKGMGLERIRQELSQMGLDEAVIESSTGSLTQAQLVLAEEALRKRMAKSPALTRQGAHRFLAGRGFLESDIEGAVGAVLGAADPFAE